MTSKNQHFESKLLTHINYLSENIDVEEVDTYYQKCMENKMKRLLQNITNIPDSEKVSSFSEQQNYKSNSDGNQNDFDAYHEDNFQNEYTDFNSFVEQEAEEEYTNEEIDAAFEEAERWADF